MEPKKWEETMTPREVKWCLNEIMFESSKTYYDKEWDMHMELYDYASDFRAARMWKSSQMRRFKKMRSCCGEKEWVAKRWSWRKLRFDKYLLGFNYGH